ncbi:hypothetical protein YT1_3637 [Rhodococcus ruber]|nr:hypothetical protein YT1_3637 [Rhodococcus ruber]
MGGVELGRHRGFGGVVFVVDSDLAQGSGLPGLGTHARVERRPGLRLSGR